MKPLKTLLIILFLADITYGEMKLYTTIFHNPGRHNTGIIHIYLENTSDKEIKITAVYYKDKPLPDPLLAYWHKIYPNPVKPGGLTKITIKPTNLLCTPVNIKITTTSNTLLTTIFPIEDNLRYCAITFTSDYKTIWIYVKNTSKRHIQLKKLEIQTEKHHYTTDLKNTLKPGELYPLFYTLESPLNPGEIIYITTYTDSKKYTTQIKTYYGFYFTGESGNPDLDIYKQIREKYMKQKIKEIYSCPMHRCDTRAESAGEALRNIYNLYTSDSESLSLIHICRNFIEQGINIYSNMTEVIRINPHNIPLYYKEDIDKNMHPTEYLINYAREINAPYLLHTLVVTNKNTPYYGLRYPEPEEIRQQVYWSIKNGSKGIIFRGIGKKIPLRLVPEMKRLGKEIMELAPYLAIGTPVEYKYRAPDHITLGTILSGNKAIILIIQNNDYTYRKKGKNAFTYRPKKDIHIQLELPEWFKPHTLYHILEKNKISFKQEQNKIRFKIKHLDISEAYILLQGG